jgi:hypothetical protein
MGFTTGFGFGTVVSGFFFPTESVWEKTGVMETKERTIANKNFKENVFATKIKDAALHYKACFNLWLNILPPFQALTSRLPYCRAILLN